MEQPSDLSCRQVRVKTNLFCVCASSDKLAFVTFPGLFHEIYGYWSWNWRQIRQLMLQILTNILT